MIIVDHLPAMPKSIRPLRGRPLAPVGRYHGITRVGILERIPFVGTRCFRRRVEAAIKAALDVRLSAGYDDVAEQREGRGGE